MFRILMRRLANMRTANRAANQRQHKKMKDIFLTFDDHISFRFITTLWLLCAATGIGGKGQLLLLLSVLKGTVSSLSLSESARLKILYKMRWQMRPLHQGAQDLGTLKQIIFVPIPLSLFQTFGASNFYSLEAISFHFQCLPLFFVCGRFILVFRFRIAVRPFSLSHSSVAPFPPSVLPAQHSSAVFHFLRRVREVGWVPHKCSEQ